MSREDQQLEALLIELGFIDENRAAEIRKMRKRTGRPLLDQCRIAHVAQEERLVGEIAGALDLKTVDPVEARVHPRVIKLLPPEVAYRWRVMPLARQRDNGVDRLFVATAHPFADGARGELKELLPGVEVRFMLAAGTRLDQALEAAYGGMPRSDTVSSRSREELAAAPRMGGSLASVDLERTHPAARPKKAPPKPVMQDILPEPAPAKAPPLAAKSKSADLPVHPSPLSEDTEMDTQAGVPLPLAHPVPSKTEPSQTEVDVPAAIPAGLVAEMDTLIDDDSEELLAEPTVVPVEAEDPADSPHDLSGPVVVSPVVDSDSQPPQENTAGAARLTARPSVARPQVSTPSVDLKVKMGGPVDRVRSFIDAIKQTAGPRWAAAPWPVRVALVLAGLVLSAAMLAAVFGDGDPPIEVAARVVDPPSARAAAETEVAEPGVVPAVAPPPLKSVSERPPPPRPEFADEPPPEFRPGVVDAPAPEGHAYVATDGAELRAMAPQDSEIVLWLRQGQLLMRVGEVDGSILVMVQPAGPAGFILAEHLTKTLPLDALAERFQFERCDLDEGRTIDDCLYEANQQRDSCLDTCRNFPQTRCSRACTRAFEMCGAKCNREEERRALVPPKKRRRRRR